VSTLGECAFSDCQSLCCISIPSSIDVIGWFCFGGCKQLSRVICGPEWTVSRGPERDFPVIYRRDPFTSPRFVREPGEVAGCLYCEREPPPASPWLFGQRQSK
jgi:hypothetical protein